MNYMGVAISFIYIGMSFVLIIIKIKGRLSNLIPWIMSRIVFWPPFGLTLVRSINNACADLAN